MKFKSQSELHAIAMSLFRCNSLYGDNALEYIRLLQGTSKHCKVTLDESETSEAVKLNFGDKYRIIARAGSKGPYPLSLPDSRYDD